MIVKGFIEYLGRRDGSFGYQRAAFDRIDSFSPLLAGCLRLEDTQRFGFFDGARGQRTQQFSGGILRSVFPCHGSSPFAVVDLRQLPYCLHPVICTPESSWSQLPLWNISSPTG